MPRLAFGVQKLLNQWVNINKDNAMYSDESPSSGSIRKQRPNGLKSSKHFSDDSSLGTTKTVSTCVSESTATTSDSHQTALSMASDKSAGYVCRLMEENSSVSNSLLNKNVDGPLEAIDDKIIPLQELNFEIKLRRGTFGATYKGSWKENNVTIKIATPVISADRWNHEISKLANLEANTSNITNIVRFFGSSVIQPARGTGGETYCLISEYIEGVSLADALEESTAAFKGYWKVLTGLGRGMDALHSAQVVHGNLKPGNIILCGDHKNNNFKVKISDYGISGFLKKSLDDINERDNLPYVAPEVSTGQHQTKASDVYSFSCIALYLMTCKKPTCEMKEKPSAFFSQDANADLVELLERCWHLDPQVRPKFGSILETLNLLSTEADTSDEVMHAEEDIKDRIGHTNDQMAQLSVNDDESLKTVDSTSKATTSKKMFLRRASLPTSEENPDTTNSPQKTTVSRMKRTKSLTVIDHLQNKKEAFPLKDDDSVSSDDSDMSIEKGAPPYKKHAPIRYSYAPAARIGMMVPQGVRLDNCHFVPLVQPRLLGPDLSAHISGSHSLFAGRISTSQNDGNLSPSVDSSNSLFHYNHGPSNSTPSITERKNIDFACNSREAPEIKRLDSDRLRASAANNFVIGENTVLEYVPSIAPAGMTLGAVRHPALMTYHVHSNNIGKPPASPIEKAQTLSIPISTPKVEDTKSNKMMRSEEIPSSESTGTQNEKPSQTETKMSKLSEDSVEPQEEGSSQIKANEEETKNTDSPLDENDARLDAATILFSQFSPTTANE